MRTARRLIAGLLVGLLFAEAPALADAHPTRVTVVDAKGRVLAGARLLPTRGRLGSRQVFDAEAKVWARSDSEGRIALTPLGLDPARRYVLWSPGLAPALVPAASGFVTVKLLPARTTHGLIRLARGRPAAGLEILALPQAPLADLVHVVRTDAAGAYRFEALYAGAWEIFLRHGQGRLQHIGRSARGGAVGETRLGDATAIRGSVLDADGTHGQAAGSIAIVLEPLKGGEAAGEQPVEFVTAADGTFVVKGLIAGIYEARMRTPDWAFEPRGPRIEVQAGRARELPTWFAVRRQTVTGTVLDGEEQPLHGVAIRLVPDPTRPLPPGADAAGTTPVTSDTRGRFLIPRVAPGEGYRLVASAKGHSAWTSHAFDVDRGVATVLKPFRLRRGWRIALRVRDLDGEPVAQAEVVATAARRPTAIDDPLWAETVRRGVTGEDGRLLLEDLPEDDVLVQVRASGHEAGLLVVSYPRVSDQRRADITLHPGTSLAGQITVPPEGVAGPFVVVARRRDGADSTRVDAEADGRFTIPNLSDSAYDIAVSRLRNKHLEHLVTVENVLPGVEELLLIRLPALRALRGTVDDLVFDGAPVSVVVETQRHDPERERHVWHVAARVALERVGRRATFAVDGLPPGLYTVRVIQGSLDTGTVAVRLDEADVDGLALRLPTPGRVAGAILDAEGGPLLGARVRLVRLHGNDDAPSPQAGMLERRSDERGDFMAEGLAPGLWRVSVDYPERAHQARVIRLREGEVLVLDDFLMGAGGAIEGLVEDADGRALDSVIVHARRFDGDGRAFILRTDGEGRFHAPHLRPGAWLLRVAAATVAGGPWIEALVEVQPGETAAVRFTAGEDGALSGTLRRRGLPVAGAVIDLVHDPESRAAPLRRYRSSTGADGRFRIDHLEAGRYTIQIQSGAWRVTHGVDLEPGDELELDLEAFGARLRGRVVTRDGRVVSGASIVATPLGDDGRPLEDAGFLGEGRSDPLGGFVLRGLPPGFYHVAVSAAGLPPGRLEHAQADLPGADFPVQVVLGRGGDVDLIVHDPHERGITGASVWLEDVDGVALHRQAYLTGARGRLRIEGVPAGAVRLRVHARGFGRPALRALVVEEGRAHRVVMALGPAGSIRLTVTGEGVDPRPRARIDIVHAATGEVLASRRPLNPIRLGAPWGHVPRAGVAVFDDLEAGHYLVRITAGRLYEEAEVPVEVKTGLEAELRVTLAPR